mmetsp:Transcript_38244/g.50393  ORF Transcript_38244/g.50393 Transcript_38244/m.50393 type:complete len:93 (+) Transcript_38244:664-942(+)
MSLMAKLALSTELMLQIFVFKQLQIQTSRLSKRPLVFHLLEAQVGKNQVKGLMHQPKVETNKNIYFYYIIILYIYLPWDSSVCPLSFTEETI